MVISSLNSFGNTFNNALGSTFGNTVCSLGRNYINSPNKAASCIIGIAAAEMALRTLIDFGRLFRTETRQTGLQDLTADLGGAVFYALAATNILPYSGTIGGLIFLGHSIHVRLRRDNQLHMDVHKIGGDIEFRPAQQNDYLTVRAMGFVAIRIPQKLWSGTCWTIRKLWEGISWVAGKLWNAACWVGRTIIKPVVDLIIKAIGKIWEGISWVAGKLWNAACWVGRTIIKPIMNIVIKVIGKIWEGISWVAGKLWDGACWVGRTIIKPIMNIVIKVIGKIWEGISWVAGKLWDGACWVGRTIIKPIVDLIIKAIGKIWEGISWVAGKLWDGACWVGRTIIKPVADLVIKAIGKIWDGVCWVARKLWAGACWVGRNIITPVWNSVIAPICRGVWNVVTSIFSAIGRCFNTRIPVHPIWLGVGLLVLSIAAFKGGSAIARFARNHFAKAIV